MVPPSFPSWLSDFEIWTEIQLLRNGKDRIENKLKLGRYGIFLFSDPGKANLLKTTAVPTCEDYVAFQLAQLYEIPMLHADVAAELELQCHSFSVSAVSSEHDATRAMNTLQALKDNNHRPSESDYDTLQAGIHRLDDEITQDDRDILSIQLKLNALLIQLSQLKGGREERVAQRNTLRSFRSPSRLLPSEILAEIFSYRKGDQVVPPSQPSLFVIAQVCRRWRDACFDCASLWDRLSIKLTDDSYAYWWEELAKLPALWFKHSDSLPLKVFLTSTMKPGICLISRVVPALIPFMHRLCSIPLMESMTLACQASGPWVHYFMREAEALPPVLLFQSAPRLRNAHSELPGIMYRSSRFPFPWKQLTHLRIDQPLNSTSWYTIFCQCRSLLHAAFTFGKAATSFTPHPAAIMYHKLSTLELRLLRLPTQGMVTAHRFDNLVFPVLEHLSLFSQEKPTRIPVDHILQQLPSGSLRCLVLARVSIQIDTLLRFLSTCTALEELCIDLLRLRPSRIFNALREELGALTLGPAMPNLICFKVCVYIGAAEDGHHHFFPTPLVDLLRSWCRESARPRRLEAVNVFFCADKARGAPYLTALRQHFMKLLQDCIYAEVACPRGFALNVMTLFIDEMGTSSPLIPASDSLWHCT